MPSTTSASRIPALDGLRGLAILLVVVSHFDNPWIFYGGTVGVTLFFVLSGFLITNILTRQVDAGNFRFATFYARRARRLLPALIVTVAAGAAIFYRSDWWAYSWPALTYTSSFFMAADGGPVLGYLSHTWSLAVEEHFYLLWPIIVAVLPARWRVKGVGLLAGTAILWRLFLWQSEPFHRMYFGTDGNAAALLLGCLIAVAAVKLPVPKRSVGVLSVACLLALAVLPFVPAREPLSFLAIALAGIAVHSAPAIRLLEVRWLGWFGTISYGLYLWHPLMMSMSHSWLMVPLSVAVAWLSWTLVEQPVLNWSGRDKAALRGVARRAVVPLRTPEGSRGL